MTHRHILIAALLLLPATGITAEASAGIDDFAFLTGDWHGTGLGGRTEEMWLPPENRRMFGIYKQKTDTGALQFTEFMEIAEVDGSFVLRLKHFDPDFTGWEAADEHVTHPLQRVGRNEAVFHGLGYVLEEDGGLRVEVVLSGATGSRTEVIRMQRRAL